MTDYSNMSAEEIAAKGREDHFKNIRDDKKKDSFSGKRGFAENQAVSGFDDADYLRKACGFTPEPFPEREAAPIYPVDALGEIIGQVARSFASYVQCPMGMAAQSVLAACALAAQAHINVARGDLIGPVSLFCLTVAESGDRKSSMDKLALHPVREYEKERLQLVEHDLRKYRADLAAWQLRHDSLIKAAGGKGKAALSIEAEKQLAAELAEHEKTKPTPPEQSNITFEEPTAEGMWRHLQRGRPSAGLFSDEGVSFFSGHGMSDEARGRTIGCMCQLYDGKPMTRTRSAEGESGVLAGRRLSCHLMVQPVVAAKVLADPLLQGQGFLPRFLVCQEDSLMGTRFLSGSANDRKAKQDPAVQRYWNCLSALLRRPIPRNSEDGGLEPVTLTIEGNAYARWVALHDGIEAQLKPDGRYYDIKAFAAKAADNAARIAAIMAFVEHAEGGGQSGQCCITPEHIDRAAKLISYYLESMRLRTREALLDTEALEAKALMDWITSKGGGKLDASEFKNLPAKYRNSKKARKLLELLVSMEHLRVVAYGAGQKPKPKSWEAVNHD